LVTITKTKSSDDNTTVVVADDIGINNDGGDGGGGGGDSKQQPTPSSGSNSKNLNNYVYNPNSTLIVTESCLNRVETLLKQKREKDGDDADGYFLRVFVDAGGCSGFQYQFEIDNELDTGDDNDNDDDEDSDSDSEDIIVVSTSTSGEPRVVVDKTSLAFLEGSKVDYVIEMIKSAFVIADNPQSESACGCGSSFAMKNFEQHGAKD